MFWFWREVLSYSGLGAYIQEALNLHNPYFVQSQTYLACLSYFGGDRSFHFDSDIEHMHHPPTVAPSKLVNSLKGVSSQRLRAEYTGRVNRAETGGPLWSPSYFAASCGGAPLEIVKEYIRGQKRPA